MDAYVLGAHEGDLPTHLLGAAGSGRVRAMSRLERSPHTVFVAVEGDTPEALEGAITAVTNAGVEAQVTMPHAASDPGVAALTISIIHIPSRMPPPEFAIFIYVESDGLAEALQEAVGGLGPNGVAVAADGKGRVLIELGGKREAVEAAAAAFTARHGESVVAHVDGGFKYA